MVDAKEGKIDIPHFQRIINSGTFDQDCVRYNYLTGWILNFFAYRKIWNKIEIFNGDSIDISKLNSLSGQRLIVPFKIIDREHNKIYSMEYKVGFIGCDINEKNEVYPVQGWIVSEVQEKN